jgi:hypothetical protein
MAFDLGGRFFLRRLHPGLAAQYPRLQGSDAGTPISSIRDSGDQSYVAAESTVSSDGIEPPRPV